MEEKLRSPDWLPAFSVALAMFMTVKLQAVSVTIDAGVVCDPQTGAYRISLHGVAGPDVPAPAIRVNILFDGSIVDVGAFTLPALSFSGTADAPAGKGAGDTVTVTVDVVGRTTMASTPTRVSHRLDDCHPAGRLHAAGAARGCTPGYWKQSQHFDSWPAGYSPTCCFARSRASTTRSLA